MTKPAMVFEDRDGQWGVEWFDDDGGSEVEIFTGADARRQALRYAMQKYGHFKEVALPAMSHSGALTLGKIAGRQPWLLNPIPGLRSAVIGGTGVSAVSSVAFSFHF